MLLRVPHKLGWITSSPEVLHGSHLARHNEEIGDFSLKMNDPVKMVSTASQSTNQANSLIDMYVLTWTARKKYRAYNISYLYVQNLLFRPSLS